MNIVYSLLILIVSLFSYMGGRILPIGFVFIIIAILIGIVITIIFIIYSIRNKRINYLVFCIIPIIIASVLGYVEDVRRTEKTKNEVVIIKKYIEEYYAKNYKLPDDDDLFIKKYGNKLVVYEHGNGDYEILYLDAMAYSKDPNIYFRQRP